MQYIMNPPIQWRFFILYRRLSDGRIFYFRGRRRRALFIRNDTTDWVSEPELARLFETQPTIADDRCFTKLMRNHPLRQQLNWSGHHGDVLRSHLIIPGKTTRRRPPG